MNRITMTGVVAFLSLTLSACSANGPSKEELTERVDQLEAEKEDLIAKVDQLTAQLDTAREKVTAVSAAADDVQAAADRFSGENWRDVVPDIQSASSDLDTARTEAADAVEEQ